MAQVGMLVTTGALVTGTMRLDEIVTEICKRVNDPFEDNYADRARELFVASVYPVAPVFVHRQRVIPKYHKAGCDDTAWFHPPAEGFCPAGVYHLWRPEHLFETGLWSRIERDPENQSVDVGPVVILLLWV